MTTNGTDLARVGTDAQRAAEQVRGKAAPTAVLPCAVDERARARRCRRGRPRPWRQRGTAPGRCRHWRRHGARLSTTRTAPGVRSLSDSQHADAVAYRLRQEAVLIAETAAEDERLAGARRPVVEPRRLVGRPAAEPVVGVQLTVLEQQVGRRGRHGCPLKTCSCQHVTSDVNKDKRPKTGPRSTPSTIKVTAASASFESGVCCQMRLGGSPVS